MFPVCSCLALFAERCQVVNVYRMISRGTLEEKIMGLQKFKLNIANTVVSQVLCLPAFTKLEGQLQSDAHTR